VEAAGKHYDYFEGFPGQGQYFVEGRAHMTTHLGNQAVEFLDGSNNDQPWSLSISFKAPHVQDGVPPYFLNDPKYDDLHRERKLPPFPHMDGEYYLSLPEALKNSENRVRWEQRFKTPELWEESVKRYYRLIHGVDVQIGRLFGELENRGMLDNTVILFSGDNGFYLGERGFAGKWYMHEESIRTPMIVADPRRPASHGQVRSEMSLNIDIAPTIQRLAGLEPPPSMNGRDLNPLVDGARPQWRTEWFYEHLFTNAKIPKSEGVRTERWKYFQFMELDPVHEEMYDLARDPREDHNLVREKEHAKQLDHMRARRKAWLANLEGWKIDQPWSEPAMA
jgi:arylsulfatase A-like enzyme